MKNGWNFGVQKMNIPPKYFCWERSNFDIACYDDGKPIIKSVPGFIYKSIGLHDCYNAKLWSVTHLNTGHKICDLVCDKHEAFELAKQVAELGDWDFMTFGGYKNVDGDIKNKFINWFNCNSCAIRGKAQNQDYKLAKDIASKRF